MEKLAILGGTPIRKRPFPEWPSYQSEEESRAVLDALRSNSLCSAIGGEQTALFETEFSDWCGAVGGVAVNSGSSANLLMTAALFYTKNSTFICIIIFILIIFMDRSNFK